jgi:hypothetical protein
MSITLQEVENLLLLDMFNARYLAGQGYRHRLVIDGNDCARSILPC